MKSKLGGIGNRFGDYSNRFAPVRWTHSISKDLVHQTKVQNIEVCLLLSIVGMTVTVQRPKETTDDDEAEILFAS